MANENSPTPGPEATAASSAAITVVGAGDLAELLPLMRAYCDFYEVHPENRARVSHAR